MKVIIWSIVTTILIIFFILYVAISAFNNSEKDFTYTNTTDYSEYATKLLNKIRSVKTSTEKYKTSPNDILDPADPIIVNSSSNDIFSSIFKTIKQDNDFSTLTLTPYFTAVEEDIEFNYIHTYSSATMDNITTIDQKIPLFPQVYNYNFLVFDDDTHNAKLGTSGFRIHFLDNGDKRNILKILGSITYTVTKVTVIIDDPTENSFGVKESVQIADPTINFGFRGIHDTKAIFEISDIAITNTTNSTDFFSKTWDKLEDIEDSSNFPFDMTLNFNYEIDIKKLIDSKIHSTKSVVSEPVSKDILDACPLLYFEKRDSKHHRIKTDLEIAISNSGKKFFNAGFV